MEVPAIDAELSRWDIGARLEICQREPEVGSGSPARARIPKIKASEALKPTLNAFALNSFLQQVLRRAA
jgi:hypothetical protein